MQRSAKLVMEAAEVYEKERDLTLSYIAGIDIGNSTTEVCVGEVGAAGTVHFLTSASCPTTGTKGTPANVHGIKAALKQAMAQIGQEIDALSCIRLNGRAGHRRYRDGDADRDDHHRFIDDRAQSSTPAGAGQAVGKILLLEDLSHAERGVPYIVAASATYTYEEIAAKINAVSDEITITGVILQADEAVLVENRLNKKLPIVDEVARIDKLPNSVSAAIEVALPGQTVRMLSNPYGIATLLGLNAEETRTVTPIAKSLIGKRSAVVLKTPGGDVHENILPAGELYFHAGAVTSVNLDEGAEKIMQALADAGDIQDISGQPDTNVGNMLNRIRKGMSELDPTADADVRITDLLAVDTLAPVLISGALAGETCLEKAVGIAAMVKTQKLPMQEIADRLRAELRSRRHGCGCGSSHGKPWRADNPGNQTSSGNPRYGRRLYRCRRHFRDRRSHDDPSGRRGRTCFHADRDRTRTGRPPYGRAD